MNKSETIGDLAAALAKAQAEIKDARAESDNPFLKSKYADLSNVLKVARPVLSANELAITQLAGNSEQDITIESVLMHSSGEWISETLRMPVQVTKGISQAQAMGAVITYARRYGAAAIIGIAQSDDDAASSDAPLYSTSQKAYFDKYISSDNAFALYLFKSHVGQDIYTELFNSGDKGEKIKLKDKARSLEALGADVFVGITEAVERDDAAGVVELIDGEPSIVMHMLANALGSQWSDCKALIKSLESAHE